MEDERRSSGEQSGNTQNSSPTGMNDHTHHKALSGGWQQECKGTERKGKEEKKRDRKKREGKRGRKTGRKYFFIIYYVRFLHIFFHLIASSQHHL